jgi:hypothetical protein
MTAGDQTKPEKKNRKKQVTATAKQISTAPPILLFLHLLALYDTSCLCLMQYKASETWTEKTPQQAHSAIH